MPASTGGRAPPHYGFVTAESVDALEPPAQRERTLAAGLKPFTRGGTGLVAKRSARRSAPSDPLDDCLTQSQSPRQDHNATKATRSGGRALDLDAVTAGDSCAQPAALHPKSN